MAADHLVPGRAWASVAIPDSKVYGAKMGPTSGRQDPGEPQVGHVNLAIWDAFDKYF